jgi:hypothetical protein
MYANWAKMGEDPTSNTGVAEAINAKALCLEESSNFDACMREHLKLCKPEIRFLIKSIADREITEEDDPAETFSNVMDAISPTKTLQKTFTEDMERVSTTPRKKSNKRVNTPADERTTPTMPTGEVYKSLNDSSKIMALAGPITAFLMSILDRQSRLFKSRFLTTALEEKHPIYRAIDNCKIREFRRLMEENFNAVYPKERRIKLCIERMKAFEFDDSKHDLLMLREVIMNTITDLYDIVGDHSGATHYAEQSDMHIMEYFNKCFSGMSPYVMMQVNRYVTSSYSSLDIDGILVKADMYLRQNNPTTYPPKEEPVRANVARTDKSSIPLCKPCKVIFGYNARHTINDCYMHPANIENKREWYNRRCANWLKNNPGKEIPKYNWDSGDDSKKRPREDKPHHMKTKGI